MAAARMLGYWQQIVVGPAAVALPPGWPPEGTQAAPIGVGTVTSSA
jgi:hypothetical protein